LKRKLVCLIALIFMCAITETVFADVLDEDSDRAVTEMANNQCQFSKRLGIAMG